MSELIDDLLELSRLSRQNLAPHPVDMTALAQSALERLEDDMAGRDVVVDIAPLPPCHGDPVLLREVLTNLLDNALKFTLPRVHARVTVRGWIEGGECIYAVEDNGVGFDIRNAGKLFTIFQRLHPADAFAGSGVGLAIVDSVVTRHGGRVWAESQPDEGARFFFSLPEASDDR